MLGGEGKSKTERTWRGREAVQGSGSRKGCHIRSRKSEPSNKRETKVSV